VIAQEAGGFVTGSKDAPHDGLVTEAILTGRRYLVIRGVAGTPVRLCPKLWKLGSRFIVLIPIFASILAGGEQPRRPEAHSAGIL
jgi:hypothetical protein